MVQQNSFEAQTRNEQTALGLITLYPDETKDFTLDLFENDYHKQLVKEIRTYGMKSLNNTDFDYVFRCQDSVYTKADLFITKSFLEQSRSKRQILAITNALEADEITIQEAQKRISQIKADFSRKYEPKTLAMLKSTVKSSGTPLKLGGQFTSMQSEIQMKEGTAIVIGGSTGTGKSGFALNLFNELSQVYPCFYINVEMLEAEVYKRLCGMTLSIPVNDLNEANSRNMDMFYKFLEEFTMNRNASGIIEDVTTPDQLRSFLHSVRNTIPMGHICVFVDHIGIMGAGHKTASIFEKTTEIMLELRQMTKEFDATIFVLAQINREGSKAERKPILEDLKGSGELEQSAHTVILLSTEDTDNETQKPLTIDIKKNRSGKLACYEATYFLQTQKIMVNGIKENSPKIPNMKKSKIKAL
jgi:replicative DNA helicase